MADVWPKARIFAAKQVAIASVIPCVVHLPTGDGALKRTNEQPGTSNEIYESEYLGAADTTVVAAKKADAIAKRVTLENMVRNVG